MQPGGHLGERPWRALPAELADTLRPELPALADETIAAIGAAIPEYARPLEGRFGRNVQRGVEQALAQFVALIGDAAAEAPRLAIYRELGAGEWRDGRSLDALQAAYRVGARVAWRRVGTAAADAGAGPKTVQLLAESIFAYIDELSAASVAGYADAQSAAAGEREARRRALAELLLRDPPAAPDALATAARDGGWTAPRTLAAVLVLERAATTGAVAAGLGPDTLALPGEQEGVLLVPDPAGPGRRGALLAALGGRGAAIGPAVAPEDAARSLRWARAVADIVGPAGCVVAEDHLAALALAEAHEPLAELGRRRLAALDALPEGRRVRLSTTLLAWLKHRGSAPAVAAELGLHPQTVRYRLAQIRELLGEALEDPQARFELELSLRARTPG
ncbi:MAG TPA: helix-turn-helix domain-containing protein [Solirubrobacteraceae bacterium]